jgi:hypothetical protein
MTASEDPAVCMRLAMSGDADPGACESCEDLCEWVPADMDEMAESIDEVRGGPRAISIRCGGAVAAMGGRVPVGDVSPPAWEVRMGSETLRKEPFVALVDFSVL